MSEQNSARYQLLNVHYNEPTRSMIMGFQIHPVSLLRPELANQFREDLALSARDPRSLRHALDLMSLERTSSEVFISTLLTYNNQLKSRQLPPGFVTEKTGLIRLDPQLREVFEITKLTKLFSFYDSPKDFIAAAKM
jgi:hypothetical protein